MIVSRNNSASAHVYKCKHVPVYRCIGVSVNECRYTKREYESNIYNARKFQFQWEIKPVHENIRILCVDVL